MKAFLMNLRAVYERVRMSGHRARALRQLEHLDQATLNDLGMSRVELVSRSYGRAAARCAAF